MNERQRSVILGTAALLVLFTISFFGFTVCGNAEMYASRNRTILFTYSAVIVMASLLVLALKGPANE